MPVFSYLIIKNYILKTAFGYSFALPFLAFFEKQFSEGDFFQNLLNAIPSKIVVVLGIIYGVAIVFKQISKSVSHHQVNNLNVKIQREHLKQEQIKTASHLKDQENEK